MRRARKRAHKNISEWRRDIWRRRAVHRALRRYSVHADECGKVHYTRIRRWRVVRTGAVDFARLLSDRAAVTLVDTRRMHLAADVHSLGHRKSPGNQGGAEQWRKRDGNKHERPGYATTREDESVVMVARDTSRGDAHDQTRARWLGLATLDVLSTARQPHAVLRAALTQSSEWPR